MTYRHHHYYMHTTMHHLTRKQTMLSSSMYRTHYMKTNTDKVCCNLIMSISLGLSMILYIHIFYVNLIVFVKDKLRTVPSRSNSYMLVTDNKEVLCIDSHILHCSLCNISIVSYQINLLHNN